jgi:hypothetical protein
LYFDIASNENGNKVEYSSEIKKVPFFDILREYNVIRYSIACKLKTLILVAFSTGARRWSSRIAIRFKISVCMDFVVSLTACPCCDDDDDGGPDTSAWKISLSSKTRTPYRIGWE